MLYYEAASIWFCYLNVSAPRLTLWRLVGSGGCVEILFTGENNTRTHPSLFRQWSAEFTVKYPSGANLAIPFPHCRQEPEYLCD